MGGTDKRKGIRVYAECGKHLKTCFWVENNLLRYQFNGTAGSILQTDAMKLKGYHNYLNAGIAVPWPKQRERMMLLLQEESAHSKGLSIGLSLLRSKRCRLV
jgi:hypothetical protein